MAALLEFAEPVLKSMTATTHFLGNCLIQVDGSKATSETYVLAFHYMEDHEPPTNYLVSARYLDRLEKRDDEWKIIHRDLINDWFMTIPATPEWVKPLFNQVMNGARAPEDRSYEFFSESLRPV